MRHALLALTLALAAPVAAGAAEPGTYEGVVTSGQGGTVELTVPQGGATVEADFQGLGNVSGTCTGVGFGTGSVPLQNNSFSFSGNGGQLSASGTFTPSIVFGSAQVLTTPCTTGSQSWRVVEADAILPQPGDPIGADVFNTTGADQTIAFKQNRGATSALFFAVRNAGVQSDVFTVKGCGKSRTLRPNYQSQGTRVTNEVVDGTFETGSVVPGGDSANLTVKLQVDENAKVGKTSACKVTADSGLLRDTVKFKVTVKRG